MNYLADSSNPRGVGDSLTLNLESIRAEFPILKQKVHGHDLVYLDNGASAQKPEIVIRAITDYYSKDHSNIHRGVHTLSQRATNLYEGARAKVKDFVSATSTNEIIFTRGTTEAINLVACSYGLDHVGPGDEVLITQMEHHSNIVPWQLLCERSGAALKVAPMDENGELIIESFRTLLSDRTRIVAMTHVSNALGTINPVRELTKIAHDAGAVVLIDGAQSAPHMLTDVIDLDCDFYVFSGHKIYGPTGIGVLYGREALLESMPPWQGGGDMIKQVRFEQSEYNDLPYKFEAGTPNIAGVVGLGAAIDYVTHLGIENIENYEKQLIKYALAKSEEQPGMRLIGGGSKKAAIFSFVLDGIHPHDIGTILDHEGVAVRAGHHCAMPVMEHFGVPATVRASFAAYNTFSEIDLLFQAVGKAQELFK